MFKFSYNSPELSQRVFTLVPGDTGPNDIPTMLGDVQNTSTAVEMADIFTNARRGKLPTSVHIFCGARRYMRECAACMASVSTYAMHKVQYGCQVVPMLNDQTPSHISRPISDDAQRDLRELLRELARPMEGNQVFLLVTSPRMAKALHQVHTGNNEEPVGLAMQPGWLSRGVVRALGNDKPVYISPQQLISSHEIVD
jgi:hypothetical protein